MLKIAKIQIAVSEKEYERIYKILNKARAAFLAEKGDSYNYRSTTVRIFEEYGKWKGYINGDEKMASAIQNIKSNPEEFRHVESLVNNYKRYPNEANARAINELVLRIDPAFRIPNDSKEAKGKVLSLLAEKLGVL